jgi:hypothetical protein
MLALRSQAGGQIYCRRGFAHAAFLIRNCYDFHTLTQFN